MRWTYVIIAFLILWFGAYGIMAARAGYERQKVEMGLNLER